MNFHFDLIRPLRSGGNADLWLARRRDTGETVVVKYLRDYHNTSARRWFAREIRILARNLTGIVRYLGHDTRPQPLYYVMSYMPHGSAARFVGRLNDAQLIFLAHELAMTLQRLHASGISHGDIKPENVLLGEQHWHLADPLGNGWGCTMVLSEHCGGTPCYWAPEVRAGRAISKAGDVYSYGATIFHIATGIQPRDGWRLDLLSGYSAIPSRVREVIVHACNPVASQRPSIREVLRILRGATMREVRQERALKTLGVLGVGALAVGLLGARNGVPER